MKKSYNHALLLILAAIIVAALFVAGQGNRNVSIAGASNSDGGRSATNAPLADWPEPFRLTNYGGQDIGPLVAGAPLDGQAQVMW